MKVRHGFVSNSSTTSFTIYGFYTEKEEEKEKAEEIIDSSDTILDYQFGEGWGSSRPMYVGRCLDAMKGDETRNQFEADVVAEIEKFFPGKGKEVSLYSESYRDG